MPVPERRKDVPLKVRQLHQAYRGGSHPTIKRWRLYAAGLSKVEEFTTLVGWTEGTYEQVQVALRGFEVRYDVERSQAHVLGRLPGGVLPPGFVPTSLPPPRLSLPPGK